MNVMEMRAGMQDWPGPKVDDDIELDGSLVMYVLFCQSLHQLVPGSAPKSNLIC
jgi:hypothetical protein